ncbi:tripartite tricarboxylate transporter TctB family protein [Roseiarcaceae bacterium H3SJ34-1]|uniref:tripartite tricarboxylate transporter TctB family protein n=1 Tax=Terripilifer ovatus TaxID=3032367 RepID=UPI003AB93DFC|nr:tripartite tricarboxylate transporter TctB family protein [Roseiarcaceae bacterium H3SJ34-1]
MTDSSTTGSGPAGSPNKTYNVSQDLCGGLFLIAVAAFFYWKAFPLPLGSLRAMGPGMLPVTIAVLLAVGGIILVLLGLRDGTARQETWHLRGPFFVLGGVIVFALLIRTAGLAIAGPASMIFASMGSDEFYWKESIIFSICMTIGCIFLFKTALQLPIPIFTFF